MEKKKSTWTWSGGRTAGEEGTLPKNETGRRELQSFERLELPKGTSRKANGFRVATAHTSCEKKNRFFSFVPILKILLSPRPVFGDFEEVNGILKPSSNRADWDFVKKDPGDPFLASTAKCG